MKAVVMLANGTTFIIAPTTKAMPVAASDVSINVDRYVKNFDASSSSPVYIYTYMYLSQ